MGKIVTKRPFRPYGWFEIISGLLIIGISISQGIRWVTIVIGVMGVVFGVLLLWIDYWMHDGKY